MIRAYYPCMHKSSAAGSCASPAPVLVLNVVKLNELRRAHDIRSEADLARIIGIDPATLYRVSSGRTTPSNGFIARMRLAFPTVSLDQLFTAVPAGAA